MTHVDSSVSEPWQMDATEVAHLIRSGKLSSREATLSCLARLEKVNPAVNAVTLVLREQALAEADAADAARARGEALGALHGVPVTTKCNTDQIGCPSDGGLVASRDLVAQSDNPAVGNLRKAGAVFIGRTNTPAFSMRFHTDNVLHGLTLNPYSKAHTAGGSSGGAGVAVATGMGAIAQGNDIGGSIRWPAYCNGVVGLRPSYGRVASFNRTAPGGRSISSQLMAVQGPLTRTVRDARLALQVMSARDTSDNRWVDVPLEGPPVRKRVALVTQASGAPAHPGAAAAVREAGRRLAAAGYEVDEVEPPRLDDIWQIWNRIGVVDVFGPLAEKIAASGDDGIQRSSSLWQKLSPPASLAEFRGALLDRDAVITAWTEFLERTPLVVMPVAAGPAFPIGMDVQDEASVARLLDIAARYLFPCPVLGLPGLSVPLGSQDGLPLGVQIIAARYREDLCLSAGEAIEAHEGVRRPVDPKF
jgi:amidase